MITVACSIIRDTRREETRQRQGQRQSGSRSRLHLTQRGAAQAIVIYEMKNENYINATLNKDTESKRDRERERKIEREGSRNFSRAHQNLLQHGTHRDTKWRQKLRQTHTHTPTATHTAIKKTPTHKKRGRLSAREKAKESAAAVETAREMSPMSFIKTFGKLSGNICLRPDCQIHVHSTN